VNFGVMVSGIGAIGVRVSRSWFGFEGFKIGVSGLGCGVWGSGVILHGVGN